MPCDPEAIEKNASLTSYQLPLAPNVEFFRVSCRKRDLPMCFRFRFYLRIRAMRRLLQSGGVTPESGAISPHVVSKISTPLSFALRFPVIQPILLAGGLPFSTFA